METRGHNSSRTSSKSVAGESGWISRGYRVGRTTWRRNRSSGSKPIRMTRALPKPCTSSLKPLATAAWALRRAGFRSRRFDYCTSNIRTPNGREKPSTGMERASDLAPSGARRLLGPADHQRYLRAADALGRVAPDRADLNRRSHRRKTTRDDDVHLLHSGNGRRGPGVVGSEDIEAVKNRADGAAPRRAQTRGEDLDDASRGRGMRGAIDRVVLVQHAVRKNRRRHHRQRDS